MSAAHSTCHARIPSDVPVTGHELRSARRPVPPTLHRRIIRCVCGGWTLVGKTCGTCADLAAARAAR